MPHLLVESVRSRKLIGQIPVGEELIRSITSLCQERQVRCGLIQATGILEDVVLVHYQRSTHGMGTPRRIKGVVNLLLCSGMISEAKSKFHLNLNVILSREGDNGIELIGGICTEAKIITTEFIIEAMDDILLRRGTDQNTGAQIWTDAFGMQPEAPASKPKASGSASMDKLDASLDETMPIQIPKDLQAQLNSASPEMLVAAKPTWADAVMASVRAASAKENAIESRVEEDESTLRPLQAGDIIEHQRFGRCIVQRVDSNQEFVTVLLRNNRIVRLNVDVLELKYHGQEDEHQCFVTGARAHQGE